MVFCELFKYMIVALTPSIFIIGLHLALEQPWVFGVTDETTQAQNAEDHSDAKALENYLGGMFYVDGFTACYTLLYVYFAISHCKHGDKTKDRDFQGWTFMLAIIANAILMCLSFVGIGISVSQGITDFKLDMQFAGPPIATPSRSSLQKQVDEINYRFRSGAQLGAPNESLKYLRDAGLVAHQVTRDTHTADLIRITAADSL